MLRFLNSSISKSKNSFNRYLKLFPMTLLATMNNGSLNSGVNRITTQNFIPKTNIENHIKKSIKLPTKIKSNAFTVPKDGTIVAYNYLHPDLLNNIKR